MMWEDEAADFLRARAYLLKAQEVMFDRRMTREDVAAKKREAIDRGEAGEEETQEEMIHRRRVAASHAAKRERWQERERRRLTEAR